MLHMAVEQLHALPPEPWGRQLTRAREDVAGLLMEPAVAKIGRYMDTSTGTLSRLEGLAEVPDVRSRRQLACIALVIYGIDPGLFGLGRDDLPPAIYAALKRDGRIRGPKFAWFTADDLRPSRAAA